MPDASQVPDVRVMLGFLGKSTRKGHWRLYLTLILNEYVEFAEDDVVRSRSLGREESALGGAVVWVRREANLLHTRSVSREAQADFLRGDIAAGFLRRSAMQRISPAARGITPWLKAACLTGGQFDTLCAACTAVPTALVLPEIRRALGLEP
ncbi:MAG TPA: hypothetical protein DEP84_10665 [Chloroflexi bacterium]|nr:hypothetical protein [Chloroflexota bacterium]